jgi:FkbH-like protein
VLELLNKTNQFNLNGDRISREALIDEMKDTDVLYFTLSDRLSDNGIVAALSIKDNAINRFVMSCRVFGLDFEYEILRKVLSMRKLDLVEVSFEFKDTDRNAAIQIFLKNISNPQFVLDDCSAILVFEMNS